LVFATSGETILIHTQDLTEQTKQIESLKIDVGRFQKENADLKQRLNKIAELEKLITEQNTAKLSLSAQIASLTTDLKTAKDDGNKTKTEVEGFLKKVAALDRKIEHLETENNDLLDTQAERMKAVQVVQSLKTENANLKTTVDELKAAKSTSLAAVGSSTSGNEEAVHALEEKIASLEKALQEWTDLAKVSYYSCEPLQATVY
jgi:phage host-nuclease inhibitor protein Gam